MLRVERNRNGRTKLEFIFAILLVACFPAVIFSEDLLEDVRKDLTSQEEWQARLAAVERLVGRHDGEAVDLLIGIAENRNEDWKVQRKAIKLLGEAGDPKAIDLLTFILNSNTSDWKCPALQSTAATALGSFKNNKHVIDALIRGTQNKELIIRETSIKALGQIGKPEVIPHLLPFLRDKNLAIRLSVIHALEKIGEPTVISSLIRVSENDTEESVRSAANKALKKLE